MGARSVDLNPPLSAEIKVPDSGIGTSKCPNCFEIPQYPIHGPLPRLANDPRHDHMLGRFQHPVTDRLLDVGREPSRDPVHPSNQPHPSVTRFLAAGVTGEKMRDNTNEMIKIKSNEKVTARMNSQDSSASSYPPQRRSAFESKPIESTAEKKRYQRFSRGEVLTHQGFALLNRSLARSVPYRKLHAVVPNQNSREFASLSGR
jgi:hypothetical protein